MANTFAIHTGQHIQTTAEGTQPQQAILGAQHYTVQQSHNLAATQNFAQGGAAPVAAAPADAAATAAAGQQPQQQPAQQPQAAATVAQATSAAGAAPSPQQAAGQPATFQQTTLSGFPLQPLPASGAYQQAYVAPILTSGYGQIQQGSAGIIPMQGTLTSQPQVAQFTQAGLQVPEGHASTLQPNLAALHQLPLTQHLPGHYTYAPIVALAPHQMDQATLQQQGLQTAQVSVTTRAIDGDDEKS